MPSENIPENGPEDDSSDSSSDDEVMDYNDYSVTKAFYKKDTIIMIRELLDGFNGLEWKSVPDNKRDDDALYEDIIYIKAQIRITEKYLDKKFYYPVMSCITAIMEIMVQVCILYEKHNIDTSNYEKLVDLLVDLEIEYAAFDV